MMVTNQRDAECNRAWRRFAVLLLNAVNDPHEAEEISNAALDYVTARIKARDSRALARGETK